MARLRVPNQRSNYLELNKRLGKYVALVQSVFDGISKDAASIAVKTGFDAEGKKDFHFADYPEAKKAVRELQQKYVEGLGTIIMRGTSAEWKESNLVCDLLADKALSYYGVKSKKSGARYRKYYQTNSDALKAFQKRKISDMPLSRHLWTDSKEMCIEMEHAISAGIQKGMSAVTLSKRVSKYLKDFDKLKDDYKEKYGHASTCHNCEYRSIRLARSEINMAYRTAEQERWKQMDFVLGYEIHLSGSHPMHDVCDMLAGKYPKDFVWTGWHPNDMCYCTPILKTEDEFFSEEEYSPREITEVPDNFKKWCVNHREYIESARKNDTLPYFLKDNKYVVDNLDEWSGYLIEEAARVRHSKRNEDAIMLALDNRRFLIREGIMVEVNRLRKDSKQYDCDLSELERYIAEEKLSKSKRKELDVVLRSATDNLIESAKIKYALRDGVLELKKKVDGIYSIDKPNSLVKRLEEEYDIYIHPQRVFDRREAESTLLELTSKVNKAYKRISARQIRRNEEKLATALGVEKGRAMTISQADKSNANPLYGTDESYNINCQSCVVAYELRRRGYNIEALPRTNSYQELLAIDTNKIWRVPVTYKEPKSDKIKDDTFEGTMAKLTDSLVAGERYSLQVTWKKQEGKKLTGHIISVEKTKKGQIVFIDPQNGKIYGDLKVFEDDMDLSFGFDLIRVDNLLVDFNKISNVVKR